jgi:hypothetical protein
MGWFSSTVLFQNPKTPQTKKKRGDGNSRWRSTNQNTDHKILTIFGCHLEWLRKKYFAIFFRYLGPDNEIWL